MKRLLKFLHTMGAIGLMGSLACLLVLDALAPPPSSLASSLLVQNAMVQIATWILFPSLLLTLVPGLLSIAFTPAFHNAGWAWVKAATGIMIFMGGLHALAPFQNAAPLNGDVVGSPIVSQSEAATMWMLLAVSTANVVLGVWRQRIIR